MGKRSLKLRISVECMWSNSSHPSSHGGTSWESEMTCKITPFDASVAEFSDNKRDSGLGLLLAHDLHRVSEKGVCWVCSVCGVAIRSLTLASIFCQSWRVMRRLATLGVEGRASGIAPLWSIGWKRPRENDKTVKDRDRRLKTDIDWKR